jgi:DNA-binding transcriptional ArsR family regulator
MAVVTGLVGGGTEAGGMSALLPRRSSVEPNTDSQVVSLDDEGSDAVFSVLSSDASRSILEALYRGPATQSELADRVDTSIQNASYHLDNLVDADLVEVVDQWYSEKGREMDVYAPSGSPLVLVVGNGDTDSASDPTHRSTGTAPQPGD